MTVAPGDSQKENGDLSLAISDEFCQQPRDTEENTPVPERSTSN
jgi:hypothetical protein